MKQRAPLKFPCKMEEELDIISDLPAHIIDQILSKIPIGDAVRTSVLSTKWRYKWMSLPYLVFDNQSFSCSSQEQSIVKNKLVNIINSVLLLHTGPIYKFKLSHRDLFGVSDIDRWIVYLSRSSFKELVLEIWKGQRYKLPSTLYSCQNLSHLELFNCLLKPPSTFNGFKYLTSLDLQYITIGQDAFENLISKCVLLETLTLMNFDGLFNLKINAPNLQFFDIGGIFDDVWFENTSVLAVVSIGLYVDINKGQLGHGKFNNMLKFFSHLPSIQRLEVQSYFLKYLSIGNIPGRLPNPCTNLNYLSIRINFNDAEEIYAAVCILKISPNLQELELLVRPEEQGVVGPVITKFWENDGHWDCRFTQLQTVKIAGITGNKPEMDFIHFLLVNSPVLEKMTVKPGSLEKGWELLKELVRFRRASVQAEIIFLDS